ncbi:phenazine biosynthesis protein PhzF family [Mariniphaga anaerophila]|uniref:Phenazine biosynthesis protein PhzF family n=1 Tax=Mariniphaga anaerophila TaxID=1484053 RepID=A0A1M4WBI7_9BACT|nr:PhzF family phenazine biosynthesis protein [Mariniphaga anaerophila]SHE78557.1 phenazine biosynthesis protein PhzF family [Mariniphaga anaerophila]
MKLKLFQVDAFAEKTFSGNPAAVVPLEEWLPSHLMQNIARENNLSETVFFVPRGTNFEIRWFTPTTEVNLCGHATLAAAFVLFEHIGFNGKEIVFHSRSGKLTVKKEEKLIVLNFPTSEINAIKLPENSAKAFGIEPQQCFKGRENLLFVFRNEKEIQNLEPDFSCLMKMEERGIIATAPSVDYDFVSRFFAPREGIDEDPVTGSAHTVLIPYWSQKSGKTKLVARQISKRGGTLYCKNLGNRVEIGGNAITYLIGEIDI